MTVRPKSHDKKWLYNKFSDLKEGLAYLIAFKSWNKPKKVQHSLFLAYMYREIVTEYDQEIPQSQTANKSMAPRGRAT